METVNRIERRIKVYKQKYYLNHLLRGFLVSLGLLLAVYLFYALLEHFVHWDYWIRAFLFYSYLGLVIFLSVKWIIIPLVKLFYKPLQISDETAAGQIGGFFPSVKDKLLNIIQLYSLKIFDPALIAASIDQKSGQIGEINFSSAVNLKENIRYVVYVVAPFIIILLTVLISPGLLQDSTKRIVYYSEYFPVPSPFQFEILNEDLSSFKNEDFNLMARIGGTSIPGEVYLVSNEKRLRIIPDQNIYSYTFRNLIDNVKFHFEAAGYRSSDYVLKVNNRPNIKNFGVHLVYPKYLNLKSESFNNIGNFQIPEGTTVHWDFETLYADSVRFTFENDSTVMMLQRDGPQKYSLSKRFMASEIYEINLKNQYASNRDRIQFHVNVIPDEFPSISLNRYQDTVLYQYLILGGSVGDDHGFTDLRLFYRLTHGNGDSPFHNMNIPIDHSETTQNYYFHWNLDSLRLKESDKLEYYVEVRDNDGIKGPKASKTGVYLFSIPSTEEMHDELAKSSQNSENQLDKNVEAARKFKEQLNELDDRLKGKRDMDWQDRKMIEELQKKKNELEEKIQKLQELYQANALKMERFQNLSQEVKDKQQELQQLFNDMLDDDTKKLFDELNKLLDENKNIDQVKDLIDQGKDEEAVKKMIDAGMTPQEIVSRLIGIKSGRLSPKAAVRALEHATPEERERLREHLERQQPQDKRSESRMTPSARARMLEESSKEQWAKRQQKEREMLAARGQSRPAVRRPQEQMQPEMVSLADIGRMRG